MRLRRTPILVALVAAGCASHERVVPWRPLPPSSIGRPPRAVIPPIPRGARFCDGPSLRFAAAGDEGENSVTWVYWFTIANRGQRACALRGRPTVTVLATGGRPVAVAAAPGTFGGASLAERTFGLAPGHSAQLIVFETDTCRILGRRARRRHAVVALIAAGHTVRLRLATCVNGVTLSVSPFQPVFPERPFRPTRFPFRATILGHPHARRGATLVYRVRLRNVSGRPFRFPWCPLFNERVAPQKGRFFMLNCRPARTIEAGKTVAFVMHLALSPHFRPGTRTLVWRLVNEAGVTQAQASARLTVER
ncbi:MAG TPA: DUF4232 domain-containing protein [Gaiellaceae bacterium]